MLTSQFFSLYTRRCHCRRFPLYYSSFSTSSDNNSVVKVELANNLETLSIHWPSESSPTPFSLLWLRDHCRCLQCTHPSHKQRLFSVTSLARSLPSQRFPQLRVAKLWHSQTVLAIEWESVSSENQTHQSLYSLNELKELSARDYTKLHDNYMKSLTLWDSNQTNYLLRKFPFQSVKSNFKSILQQLHATGFVLLSMVPSDKTIQISQMFGPTRNTFYGETWDVIADDNQAKNIAYTSTYLGLHTDLTYMEAPPGIQYLHCLRNTVKGGESFIADGLRAASLLQQKNSTGYEMLSSVPVTFQYVNDNKHYSYNRPIINRDMYNPHLNHLVTYAPPFQGPLCISQALAPTFYDALLAFEKELYGGGSVEFLLKEGDLMIFNNRRVMHARKEFDVGSGKRHLRGIYTDLDDFMNLVRLHNII